MLWKMPTCLGKQNFNAYLLLYCLSGPKHRQRFLCEVRVDGISYLGAGNSTTKKEAQVNASRDFVNYLIRSGVLSQSEVPEDSGIKVKAEVVSGANQSQKDGGMEMSQRPVFQVIN